VSHRAGGAGTPISDRRAFLKSAAYAATGVSLGCLAGCAAPARVPSSRIVIDRLSDRLLLFRGAGGNVVALTGPEGVLMVDGGLAEHTHELLAAVAGATGGRPVHTLFNTHWHWEHTGSNERIRRMGATIIAHENTKLWLGTPVWEAWQDRMYLPRPPEALPTRTFYTSGEMIFGGEPIEYGYLMQAHTDSDIYVYFRNHNVLVAGGVVTVGRYPVLDYCTGGWIDGMRDAAQQLVMLTNDQTRIIPGTGPVQTRADVTAEHAMLAELRESIWKLMCKGLNADDILATKATRAFDAKWGDPTVFVRNAYQGLYGHARDIRGAV
jgi:glyoxylase-like metal-dependent hydrolase (beta-lactamase superfamily II)